MTAVFGGGKVEGSFNFLAWIVSGIGKAEQVIGDGKVGLTFGYVGSEMPAYQRMAEDSKYRLRNNWFSWDPNIIFPRETEKQCEEEMLAKSDTCPILACHD